MQFLQLFSNSVRHHLLGLTTGGAISDGDYINLVCLNPVRNLLFAFVSSGLISNDKNMAGIEYVPARIENCNGTSPLKPWIDRQNGAVPNRRLEQKVSKVVGKHFDGMFFGSFGQLTPNFPLEAGDDQAIECVIGTFQHELTKRMLSRNQGSVGCLMEFIAVNNDSDF